MFFGLKSETAAAQTAMSTGKISFTSFIISLALTTFFTSISLEKFIFVGPEIKVVFIPSLDKASAISYPCFPLDSFEIYLTGSMIFPCWTRRY